MQAFQAARAVRHVVGVDVGSTSARAGVFDADGRMLAAAAHGFAVHRPAVDQAEHSSEEIWGAVCAAVRAAVAQAGVVPEGLAFDAACSLVLLDAAGRPASVSVTGQDRWDTVMWADHRAVAEAAEITATGHRVLDHVGGVMSPEMALPKLLWLKRHMPEAWARYGMGLDLADFLAWRATGALVASACTVTCKWTYLNHEAPGWQDDLLARIGLGDLRARLNLPARAAQPGERAGGLAPEAAAALGLPAGIAVGVGLIDAHAGGLGLLGRFDAAALNTRLAVIAGTSTCHMAVSAAPRAIPGVWGPYLGAMLPGLWLNEGGQSATGALLDHLLDLHAEGRGLGPDRHARIAEIAERGLAAQGAGYAAGMLVLPDFNGNRSPLADPHRRGAVLGLDLDASVEGLARLYFAAACGIAHGTRHVAGAMDARGYAISELHLTGGHARSKLLVRVLADVTGLEVVLAREPDAVLLGTAMVAAAASGLHPDLAAAGRAMAHEGRRVRPDPAMRARHDADYRRFRQLLDLG